MYFVNLFRITPRKTEQPIQGTELQEREEDKDEKHLEKLIRRPRREQMPIRSKHRAIQIMSVESILKGKNLYEERNLHNLLE